MLQNNFVLRVVSALVLAPCVIGAAYVGGLFFALFWGLVSGAILWEWTTLVSRGSKIDLLIPKIATALVIVLLGYAYGGAAVAIPIVGFAVLAGAILGPRAHRVWIGAGVAYSGALLVSVLLLRSDAEFGFYSFVFLFAVVWSTENAGYFVGKAIGGPKLARSISPNKTWSGAVAGLIGGALAAAIVLPTFGTQNTFISCALGCLLSVAAQMGDLLESALKRRFAAKDTSSLIPGHGGAMDRFDGFWSVTIVAIIIGAARGGFVSPAKGLLLW